LIPTPVLEISIRGCYTLASVSMEDTIAAISTPPGIGGIAIVRVSGNQALEIADNIFRSPDGKVSEYATHTVHFGTVRAAEGTVDFVLLTVMHGPKNYTGENTVEINCHGGQKVAGLVLDLCLQHGARLAEPGEFTKRAFLNGKMDLAQAESVMDLIKSKSDLAHRSAIRGVGGRLSKKLQVARSLLINILTKLEASIDFPEEEIPDGVLSEICEELLQARKNLRSLLQTAKEGRLLRHGAKVVIVGRPNCGKSSLMNALAGETRSIVTAVPGTTRDLVEHMVEIGGYMIRLVDTAGIRKPRGEVERIGVQYARESLADADLVLHVLDISKAPSPLDDELKKSAANIPRIAVLNKRDLQPHPKFKHFACDESISIVSALLHEGIDQLRDAIERKISREVLQERHSELHLNERHELLVRSATNEILDAVKEMKAGATMEIAATHIQSALRHLAEVDGSEFHSELLDSIFSSFCIGK